MPYNDVTELVRVRIDSNDRLLDYQLRKQSCGVTIGAGSDLIEKLRRRTIAEILELDIDTFCGENVSGIEKFMTLKHLLALRMTLEMMIGRHDGSPKAACRIININYDEDSLVVEAEIAISIETGKIMACGACCLGCETKKALRVN